MGLAKVRMVIRVHQRADGRPEIPAGGPVQPPPGPAGVVLDRRIPGAATARTPWTTPGYAEKVRSQFLSLRQSIRVVCYRARSTSPKIPNKLRPSG